MARLGRSYPARAVVVRGGVVLSASDLSGTSAGTSDTTGDLSFESLLMESLSEGLSTSTGDLSLRVVLEGISIGTSTTTGTLPSGVRRNTYVAGNGSHRRDADLALAGAGSKRS